MADCSRVQHAASIMAAVPKGTGPNQRSIKQLLLLTDDKDGVHMKKEINTAKGTLLKRYTQMFNGIEVYDSGVTIEEDPATGEYLQNGAGHVTAGIGEDVTSTVPRITSQQAIDITKKRSGLNPARIRFQEATTELFIRTQCSDGTACVAYRVRMMAVDRSQSFPWGTDSSQMVTRPEAFVDANTGEVLEYNPSLITAKPPPPLPNSTPVEHVLTGVSGGNLYTGETFLDLNVTDVGGVCVLRDILEDGTSTFEVLDARSTSSVTGKDSGYRWSCSEGYPGDAQDDAYGIMSDVFFGVVQTKNMFADWADMSAGQIFPTRYTLARFYAHYGRNYDNAFFSSWGYFAFGDGKYLYPFVTLDIVAHEICHSVTDRGSNLQYSGQSGGMNEAFSDMCGIAAEFFTDGNSSYRIGDGLIKNSGEALRDFCNPTADGRSIDHVDNYHSRLDVHYSSGLYNKVACELSKMPVWDFSMVFRTFVTANVMFWQPTTGFQDGACGVMKAAQSLGYPDPDVINAFALVGIVDLAGCTVP